METAVIPSPNGTAPALFPDMADRRHEHIRKVRKFRKIMKFTSALGVLLTAMAVGFHALAAYALTRPIVSPLSSNPLEAIDTPYVEVQFPSTNGKTVLEGWYIPARESVSTVIFSHGYGANREESWVPIYDLAKAAHMQNYNVLMFDYGFVQPEHRFTGGVQETRELLGAVEFAKQQGAEHIYIWGFSMGAGTALQAALVSPDIDGMILDSTFLLSPDTLYHNIRAFTGLPRFPSVPLLQLLFPLVSGGARMQDIPYETIARTQYDIPIYMIHGQLDSKAPYEVAQAIANNQSSHPLSGFWLLPDGQHELLYIVNRKQYLTNTLSFLDRVSQFGRSDALAMH